MAASSSELTGGIRGPFGPPRLATDDLCYSRKVEAPKDAGCRCTQMMRIRSRRHSAYGSSGSQRGGATVIVVLQAISKFEMKS